MAKLLGMFYWGACAASAVLEVRRRSRVRGRGRDVVEAHLAIVANDPKRAGWLPVSNAPNAEADLRKVARVAAGLGLRTKTFEPVPPAGWNKYSKDTHGMLIYNAETASPEDIEALGDGTWNVLGRQANEALGRICGYAVPGFGPTTGYYVTITFYLLTRGKVRPLWSEYVPRPVNNDAGRARARELGIASGRPVLFAWMPTRGFGSGVQEFNDLENYA